MKKFLYYLEFVLVPIASVGCLVSALESGFTILIAFAWACGAFAWTFIEYAVHYYTHVTVDSNHFRHHIRPIEFAGPPLFVVGFIVWLIYGVLRMFVDQQLADAAISGLLGFYTVYLLIHDAIHRRSIEPGSWLHRLKDRHEKHHAGDESKFGVITNFWDLVFGTETDRRVKVRK